MPDLMVYADKGLKGISRTGGTLLGADCSTEKMPAAIRLSFAGDADGLAMLADRHGANILSAQEPTTGVTPAWAAAHQNHADVVQLLDKRGALLGVATFDECGATPSRSACAPGTRPMTTSSSGSMFMPSGSDRLKETSVVGSSVSTGGLAAGAGGDDSSKRRIKTGAPSSTFAWRRERNSSYEATGASSTAIILAPGGTP